MRRRTAQGGGEARPPEAVPSISEDASVISESALRPYDALTAATPVYYRRPVRCCSTR
jgi:hypothetical protein